MLSAKRSSSPCVTRAKHASGTTPGSSERSPLRVLCCHYGNVDTGTLAVIHARSNRPPPSTYSMSATRLGGTKPACETPANHLLRILYPASTRGSPAGGRSCRDCWAPSAHGDRLEVGTDALSGPHRRARARSHPICLTIEGIGSSSVHIRMAITVLTRL